MTRKMASASSQAHQSNDRFVDSKTAQEQQPEVIEMSQERFEVDQTADGKKRTKSLFENVQSIFYADYTVDETESKKTDRSDHLPPEEDQIVVADEPPGGGGPHHRPCLKLTKWLILIGVCVLCCIIAVIAILLWYFTGQGKKGLVDETSNNFSVNYCKNPIPGTDKLSVGIDLSHFDINGLSEGRRQPVLKFTCDDTRSMNYDKETYEIPYEFLHINKISTGELQRTISSVKTTNDLITIFQSGVTYDSRKMEVEDLDKRRKKRFGFLVGVATFLFGAAVKVIPQVIDTYDPVEKPEDRTLEQRRWGIIGRSSRSYSSLEKSINSDSNKVMNIQGTVMTMQVKLQPTTKLQLDPSFLNDAMALPDQFDEKSRWQYYDFIQAYGTHYIHDAKLGGKVILETRINHGYYKDKNQEHIDKLCYNQFKETFGNLKNSSFTITKQDKDENETNTKNYKIKEKSLFAMASTTKAAYHGGEANLKNDGIRNWSPTVRKNPEILKAHLKPLYDLIADQHKQEQLMKAIETYLLLNSPSDPETQLSNCYHHHGTTECCPNGDAYYNGYCYRIHQEPMTWKQAYQACVDEYSTLALSSLYKDKKWLIKLLRWSLIDEIWLDQRYNHTSQQFMKTSEDEIKQLDIKDIEPIEKEEVSCILMTSRINKYEDGSWLNKNCQDKNKFICVKDKNQVLGTRCGSDVYCNTVRDARCFNNMCQCVSGLVWVPNRDKCWSLKCDYHGNLDVNKFTRLPCKKSKKSKISVKENKPDYKDVQLVKKGERGGYISYVSNREKCREKCLADNNCLAFQVWADIVFANKESLKEPDSSWVEIGFYCEIIEELISSVKDLEDIANDEFKYEDDNTCLYRKDPEPNPNGFGYQPPGCKRLVVYGPHVFVRNCRILEQVNQETLDYDDDDDDDDDDKDSCWDISLKSHPLEPLQFNCALDRDYCSKRYVWPQG